MEKLHELKLCCGKYPNPRYRKADGARRVVCGECDASTEYYLPVVSAGLTANIAWNEMRDKQVNLLRNPIVVED